MLTCMSTAEAGMWTAQPLMLASLLRPNRQVKSYLAGNPAIRLALNEDLAVGRQEGNAPRWGTGGGDVVMLDDCNFHESVSLDRFETDRMLELVPPDGEFALMQYRQALVPGPAPAVKTPARARM